jgi:hypothetical protein
MDVAGKLIYVRVIGTQSCGVLAPVVSARAVLSSRPVTKFSMHMQGDTAPSPVRTLLVQRSDGMGR